MSEVIGGLDNGGGIPVADGTNRAGLAGGGGAGSADALEYWLPDFDLVNNIFGAFGLTKVLIVTYFWFIHYEGGSNIYKFYYWTWFSALVTVYTAWGPVTITWLLLFIPNLLGP